jgi:hypothetical protein
MGRGVGTNSLDEKRSGKAGVVSLQDVDTAAVLAAGDAGGELDPKEALKIRCVCTNLTYLFKS